MSAECLADLIHRQAERHPDAIAILSPGRAPLSYGQLHAQLHEVVEALDGFGLRRNDRLAVVLPDGPEMAVAVIAIGSAFVCAPLNPAYRTNEFEAHLKDLQCRAVLLLPGEGSSAARAANTLGIPILELTPVDDAPAGVFVVQGSRQSECPGSGFAGPEDFVLALHTSGTAARPKLVSLRHRHICAAAHSIRDAVALTAKDRCLNVMPLFHIHGQSTVFASLAAGASVICSPGYSAGQFFEWIETLRPTWYSASPTIHLSALEQAARHPDIASHSGLRFIRSASAAMPTGLIADLERSFGVPVIEAYGMTEAAPQIASNRLSAGGRRIGSVGRPAGPEVAILGEDSGRLPEGQTGEIAIRGANVVERYESTGCEGDGGKTILPGGWLRTGDLGYLDPDGFLFITGRLKEVINRGGEKISPREVDEVLLAHAGVAEAATFAIPHHGLGEAVAAAIVLKPGASVTPAEIREFAAERLAYFKVPQQIAIVAEIPKSAAGKVERLGLASRLGLMERDTSPQPRTPLERKISEVWAGVLGVERPGIHDDFFLLGGQSLSAVQIVTRLRHEFEVELPMTAVFAKPTIAEQAELVSRARSSPTRIFPHREDKNALPLSLGQQRLWFLDRLTPGSSAYNIASPMWLAGDLDVGALERCLDEIRRRHEVLRTSFPVSGDGPTQVVAPWQATPLPVIDLTGVPREDRAAQALSHARKDAELPFDLAQGNLFRATLIRIGATEYALLLTVHHIVSDGWSTAVLHREICSLYRAFRDGDPSPLRPLPIQYADFAAWQRTWFEGEELGAHIRYWAQQLRDFPPPLELPACRPRPEIQTQRGSKHEFEVRQELRQRLGVLASQEGVTVFMTLMAALQMLIYRHTGREDFVIGIPIANRILLETEPLIGFFANTLPIRADLSKSSTYRELLAQVRQTANGAYAHQDVPFEKLMEILRPARDLSRGPLISVMLAYQNVPDGGSTLLELAPGITGRPFKVDNHSAKFDLTLYLTETSQGLAGAWQFDTGLYDRATIAHLASEYTNILEAISLNPEHSLADLNESTSSPPESSFVQLFEEQCARTPAAAAILCDGRRLTYGELNQRANQLAWYLRRIGVGQETLVGVALPRSEEMVIALLGILKSGGAYVPLDPDYPPARISFLMKDSQLRFLITERWLATAVKPESSVVSICLDSLGAELAKEDPRNLPSITTASDLAYVIYTSGSTGEPKGVMVTHGNMRHCAEAIRTVVDVSAADRYLHTASFSFSSSVRQMAVPLSCGASVVIAQTAQIRDPHELFALIRKTGTTILDLVPSHWRTCLRALPGTQSENLGSVRLILSASETLPADLPREWISKFGQQMHLFNMYGQTETTGIVTVHPIGTSSPGEMTIPIGRPIADTRVELLDQRLKPVPLGVPGDVYVGGAGVARGYWNNAQLTSELFVTGLADSSSQQRMYRTGDRARCLPDGNLEFMGRSDDQIKIRGFRIEAAEVEIALKQHPWVWESAVVAQTDSVGLPRLTAFVVAKERVLPTRLAAELRRFLKSKLPDYMIPAVIVDVESLPLTVHRKLDRKALAARTVIDRDGSLGSQVKFKEPRTHAERVLAGIWRNLLQLDRVSVDDNFFDLGGDSLLSVAVVSRANQAGLQVSVKEFFQHQTIAELARALSPSAPPPRAPEDPETIRVTLESLRSWGCHALEQAGLSPEGARIVTEVQIEASLRGQPTHNVDSIPRYARRILAGAMNPFPNVRVERETALSAQIDGDNGPGQWVAVVAMETAIRKARETGVGLVSVRRSNHFGAAGHYVWMAAKQGLIGLCTTNGPVILAPTGGTTPTFGNNPLGVGIPAGERYPILLDIAMSVAPRGKIGLQLVEGKPLPHGWILDRFGRHSIDPVDLAAGLGVPIGGHKGYGLALVMEALAGALSGAGFCTDHRAEKMRNHAEPRDLGHFFMAIDPELFSPIGEFTARVDRMIEITKAGERAENVEEILIPGEAELRARERNLQFGVPLRPVTYRALLKYGEASELDAELTRVK